MTQTGDPHIDTPKARDKKPERAARPSETKAAPEAEQAALVIAAYDPWQRASQVALVGMFVIALLWCAYIARHVIVPVVLAWVIATIVLPIVKWLQERRVPRVVAAIAVTAALAATVALLLLLLASPITVWLGRVTELAATMQSKLRTITGPLSAVEEIRKTLNTIGASGAPALKVEQQSETVVTSLFTVVAPALSQFVLGVGALLFYLVYRQRLRGAVVMLLGDRGTRLTALRTLNDIDAHMTTYFGTFTIVNVCLGLVTAALAWLVGLPNPLLWGALAGVLNYLPYVGPALVTVTLAVAGLLTFPTLGEAAVAPIIFLGIVTVEGQFLTPAFMGSRLELNPFAVFLAIAFCTWLWGPVGAFVAVPLLMALTVSLGHALGEDPPELPH